MILDLQKKEIDLDKSCWIEQDLRHEQERGSGGCLFLECPMATFIMACSPLLSGCHMFYARVAHTRRQAPGDTRA